MDVSLILAIKFLQLVVILQILAHTARQADTPPPNYQNLTPLNYQNGPTINHQNRSTPNDQNSQPVYYRNGPLLDYQNGRPQNYHNDPPSNDPNGEPSNYQNGPPLNYQNSPPPNYEHDPLQKYQTVPPPDYQNGLQPNYQKGSPQNYRNGQQPNHQIGPPTNNQNAAPLNYQNDPRPRYQDDPSPNYQNGPPLNDQKAGPLRSGYKFQRPTVKRPSTRHYDPNYGFKEYWPGGDWVLYTTTATTGTGPTTTTKPIPRVCGRPCPEPFHNIDHVCGRWSTNDNTGDTCPNGWMAGWLPGWLPGWSTKPIRDCKYPDDYTKGFDTYETYCSFLRQECIARKSFKNDTRLVFVHVGKCKKQNDYFLPMRDHPIKTRLDGYVKKIKQRFDEWGRTWSS